jgi:Protein of unknown function (DUF454).
MVHSLQTFEFSRCMNYREKCVTASCMWLAFIYLILLLQTYLDKIIIFRYCKCCTIFTGIVYTPELVFIQSCSSGILV